MHYQVSRNGQMYGPYTLEDLERYVASGNVLGTDLAKSEEMAEWVPVSQLLTPPAAVPPPVSEFASPGYADPTPAQTVYMQAAPASATMAASAYPDAPNLHWGLVLLFGFLTCWLFMLIWNLVIAAWLKKVQPNATAVFYYVGVLVLLGIDFIVGGALAMRMITHSQVDMTHPWMGPLVGFRLTFALVIWVVRLIARYSERASLEEHFNGPEPIGLQLNPVMTFFFGGIYFQYHLNRINAMKQASRFGAGRAF